MIASEVLAGLGVTSALLALLATGRWPALGAGLAAVAWVSGVVPELSREVGVLHPIALVVVVTLVVLAAARSGRQRPRPARRATAAHAVLAIGLVLVGLVVGGADAAGAVVVALGALGVVPWLVGRHLASRDAAVAGGWEYARRWETAAGAARQDERQRIAAEMHDAVGHELARTALHLGALELDPVLEECYRDRVRGAREGVGAAAQRLAETVRVLAELRRMETSSVTDLVDGARAAGAEVEQHGDDLDTAAEDPLTAETVRRVVQESLTNAMKHGVGAVVSVHATASEDTVEVVVANAAPPSPRPTADSAGAGGTGLVRLAERVRLLGGHWSAGRDDAGCFVVRARLPRRSLPLGDDEVAGADVVAEQRRVIGALRASRRAVVAIVVALVVATAAAATGYVAFDAVTSTLEPADFDALVPGTRRVALEPVLPPRTRIDDPTAVPPVPPGAECEYYSTHVNAFDARRLDLFRLCFRDDLLVTKDLVVRG